MLEEAAPPLSVGDTEDTAGAMRFADDTSNEMLPFPGRTDDPRIKKTDFGPILRPDGRPVGQRAGYAASSETASPCARPK